MLFYYFQMSYKYENKIMEITQLVYHIPFPNDARVPAVIV